MESTYRQKPDSKQELAEERTEAAHVRSLLAKERTFSAWLRTGLAMLATGFAAAKLLTDVNPRWLVPVLSALFVVVGGAIFVIGYGATASRSASWRRRKACAASRTG